MAKALPNTKHKAFREDVLAMLVDDVLVVKELPAAIVRNMIRSWHLHEKCLVITGRHGKAYIIRTDA